MYNVTFTVLVSWQVSPDMQSRSWDCCQQSLPTARDDANPQRRSLEERRRVGICRLSTFTVVTYKKQPSKKFAFTGP